MKLGKEGTSAMERNLTTGSVFKNVVLFSLPYLLSYFLQTLCGMADLFIIGQSDGVASIGLDYLLMGVMRLGPAGAALGTTLSQAISVAVSLLVILK